MIMRLLTISLALIVRRRKSRKKYDSKMLKKSKLKMLIFNFSYKDSVHLIHIQPFSLAFLRQMYGYVSLSTL